MSQSRVLTAFCLAASLFTPLAAQPSHLTLPARGPKVSAQVARQNLRSHIQALIDEFMELHNQARSQVGVPPLQWDPELASHAQQWADQLALQGGLMGHSEGDEGENLAIYLPTQGERPVHGAMLWYAERGRYHGEPIDDSNYLGFGHYTQMVWRDTTHVGFGIAMASNGNVILVARYRAPGNMQGEKAY